jgi:branched-chain amino acid transport system ATP-binding protein
MSVLRVEGIGMHFGGVAALRDVTFSASQGEILGVMGANGAGKTTLFSLIAGNQKPTDGEILFDDRVISGQRPDRISRMGVARTFQIVRPFGGMTVLENVAIGAMYGARRAAKAEAEDIARAILEEIGLAGRADDPASTLTLAARKRLEVGRALATQPKLLLLDEVLAGLTATEVDEALAMIRAIHETRGLTVLVIEHVMRALMQLCDRIVVLHHGVKITEGTPHEVAENPDVIDAYLGEEA